MRTIKTAIAAASLSAALLAAAALTALTAPAALAARAVTGAATGLPSSRITPNPSSPGTATTFGVFCGQSADSATLYGTVLDVAALITMHSTPSTTAGEFVVTITLPLSLRPGTYHPDIICSNGISGTVTLMVNPVPGPAPPTGDGTAATTTGTPLAPVGYAMIGVGAVAALVALRRRSARRG